MAFDKQTRNRLAGFVGEARNLIANEFTEQFQSLYGISDRGEITPLDQLGHLDDAGLAIAELLRERIDYLIKTHPEDKNGIHSAVERLAREQAFTVLNRLAAIRMAEKRGIIVEAVGNGYQSKGFKVYEQVAGSGLGDTYHRYRRYLFCLFDELSVDLGILFDRSSPQGLLFPRETSLQSLFSLLNAPDIDALWAEDETIGWIYQYYNDPAERKKMRDESAAPRNSRELAVRNQFFTPRYVVEFLTDNTLGRIWYEMTKGQTRLKDQCRYLVRRPTEIFLNPEETAPELPTQDNLSQDELLKQSVYIPHRPIKDPREILMLDPACGSMHFGLYAFDLYEAIYEEAWDIGMEALRCEYPEKESLLRDVPRLIIEANINGVDIDPRAAQIAGLSLWMRAQKSWQTQKVSAARRPTILRSNVVCAEPMPGNPELLKAFTSTLKPPLLGQLVEKVFVQMQLAGEAGSLLKIEDEIAALVQEAKKVWLSRPRVEQMELNLGMDANPLQGDLPLDLSGISNERFWDTAEDKIYTALRTYAEQSETNNYQRRLFSMDASQGFSFIDLCSKLYDVVLMNPPFGEGAQKSREYIEAQYADARYDVLTCFIERGINMLSTQGALGIICNRTPFFLPMLSDWRTRSIIKETAVTTFADLGHGILDDAMVEVCAVTLTYPIKTIITPFFKVVSAVDKRATLEQLVSQFSESKVSRDSIFLKSISDFLLIPKSPFSYWLPQRILHLFTQTNDFDKHYEAWVGLQTNDDLRWLRLRWEIPQSLLNKKWFPFAKGGEYSEFVSNIHLVVDWEDNGKRIKAWKTSELELGRINANNSKCWNETKYLRKGITWTQRTSRRFSARILPEKCIFGIKGPSAFSLADSDEELLCLLGLFETDVYKSLLEYQVAAVDAAAKSYDAGLVRRTPFPSLTDDEIVKLASTARTCVNLAINKIGYDETSSYFVSMGQPTLDNDFDVHKLQLNTIVHKAYGLDNLEVVFHAPAEDALETEEHENTPSMANDRLMYLLGCVFGRWDISFTTEERQAPELPDLFAPLPVCPPGMLQNYAGLPAEPKDVPANYPLRISWPGILVDDENHPENIVVRIREVIEVIWRERSDAIESEACELLGVKTLHDYFCKPSGFFADHLKRYSKSRRQAPIYWPLSSSKGSYSLWIYYHRLTDQTLHTALADFVDPKIKAVRAEISSLLASGTNRSRLEELQDLEKELIDFRNEIERIIKLPWQPNLNDGVLITASPLWKLFRLPKWQKDLKACWQKLENGEYEWAHLAYSIWPKRVEEACKKDRSIAIAHNLEHLCQATVAKPKSKRGKKSSPVEGGQE